MWEFFGGVFIKNNPASPWTGGIFPPPIEEEIYRTSFYMMYIRILVRALVVSGHISNIFFQQQYRCSRGTFPVPCFPSCPTSPVNENYIINQKNDFRNVLIYIIGTLFFLYLGVLFFLDF